MRKKKFWHGVWEFVIFDKTWKALNHGSLDNSLADEGEKLLIESFFRDENVPTAFYLGLCNSFPNDEKTLATIVNEMSGNGYGRLEIPRSVVGWPTLELDLGDWRVTSKLAIFEAVGGNIGPFKSVFLTDVASGTDGKLIAYTAFSEDQTILEDAGMGIRMRIKFK